MDQPVSGVPESHHLIQAFFAEYFHPFQAVDIKGASRLGIAFQSETAQYGFQADPGLHEIFHSLELILCQFLSGSAKLAVEVIAFFISADYLVNELLRDGAFVVNQLCGFQNRFQFLYVGYFQPSHQTQQKLYSDSYTGKPPDRIGY